MTDQETNSQAVERRIRAMLALSDQAVAAAHQECATTFLNAWLHTVTLQLHAQLPDITSEADPVLGDLLTTAFSLGCRAFVAVTSPDGDGAALPAIDASRFNQAFKALAEDGAATANHLAELNAIAERQGYLEACVAMSAAALKERLTAEAIPLAAVLPMVAQGSETGFHVEMMLWRLAASPEEQD